MISLQKQQRASSGFVAGMHHIPIRSPFSSISSNTAGFNLLDRLPVNKNIYKYKNKRTTFFFFFQI